MGTCRIDDEVVSRPGSGDVCLSVVDDVVGASRAHHVHLSGAAHPRDLGSEILGNLYCEGPDAPGRSVDQNVFAGLQSTGVTERLESSDS